MKFIISLAGTAALSASADDVAPQNSLMLRDLTEFIGSTYQFSVKPEIPVGVPPFAIRSYVFQSGIMIDESGRWPIIQLSIVPNGDMVTAATTDIAVKVLDDFGAKLDSSFGFRFATAPQRRLYQSLIVVQFEKGIEEQIKALSKIEDILNHTINRPTMPFKIKRLAFGSGDVQQFFAVPASLEAIENSDFIIERRSSVAYSENRYFCGAPLQTLDHVKVLETIERALGRNVGSTEIRTPSLRT